MLTIASRAKSLFCDRVSRRDVLQIGAWGVGSLTLADLLRADALAGQGSSGKSVINIHLGGGPSHQDMFDLKPEAPVEFRGEFNPIRTNVAGIEICEHMPLLAQMADKYAIIRSLVGSVGQHASHQTHSGFSDKDLRNAGGRPALGSVVSRLLGNSDNGAPPFISYNGGSPGFLGPAHKPYRPQGGSLKLSGQLTAERVSDRTDLLSSLDRIRRDMDGSGQMNALDVFTQRAVEVVTSGTVADALDLKMEDAQVRECYGDDGKMFLTARRLVEAGVRVVTLNWGGWDTHGGNFTKLREQLPKLDRSMSTLIQDLYDRGLDQDVSVVMWGEFGRTPRVNSKAGRDHWPKVAFAFLSGGGMQTGQVIGSTTKDAGYADDRPVHFQEVLATLYHNLGIDAATTTIADFNGRPQYLLEHRRPVHELI